MKTLKNKADFVYVDYLLGRITKREFVNQFIDYIEEKDFCRLKSMLPKAHLQWIRQQLDRSPADNDQVGWASTFTIGSHCFTGISNEEYEIRQQISRLKNKDQIIKLRRFMTENALGEDWTEEEKERFRKGTWTHDQVFQLEQDWENHVRNCKGCKKLRDACEGCKTLDVDAEHKLCDIANNLNDKWAQASCEYSWQPDYLS